MINCKIYNFNFFYTCFFFPIAFFPLLFSPFVFFSPAFCPICFLRCCFCRILHLRDSVGYPRFVRTKRLLSEQNKCPVAIMTNFSVPLILSLGNRWVSEEGRKGFQEIQTPSSSSGPGIFEMFSKITIVHESTVLLEFALY